MPKTRPTRPKLPTDPGLLTPAERDYCRATWGFDPVDDCQSRIHDERRYEAGFPLEQDPALHTAGVTICARVDWHGTDIHNRIVFRRGRYEEAAVECTHTVVVTGRAEQAWTLAEDIYTAPERLSETDRAILARGGGPVALPPWEHFAALKSYVAAVAGAGIVNLLGALVIPQDEEKTHTLPFGFNTAMQWQIARAIKTVASVAWEQAMMGLALALLEQVPPQWIAERWAPMRLDEIYPMAQVFEDDPQRLLAWLQGWEKGAPNLFDPGGIRQVVDPILRHHWQVLLRAWDAETVTRWFRHSDVLDGLQDYLFDTPEVLAQAREIAPALPWDQLRLEHDAKGEVEEVSGEMQHGFPMKISTGDYPRDYPPAEVWPRAPCCAYEFPRAILDRDPSQNRDPIMRRKRYRRLLTEARRCSLRFNLPDAYKKITLFNRQDLAEEIAKPFPEKLDTNFDILPPTEDQLRKMLASGHAEWRRAAAMAPILPTKMQEKLILHWDYATRLSLCVNPSISQELLQKFTKDVQPCIRAVVQSRLLRGGATIEPLVGEILGPGEVLWLLAAHPTTYFQFGVTTWGDGSDDYAAWWARQVAKDTEIQADIGRMNA